VRCEGLVHPRTVARPPTVSAPLSSGTSRMLPPQIAHRSTKSKAAAPVIVAVQARVVK
jgi:hypothetical protein